MQIQVTESAYNDLLEIWRYGYEKWGDTAADQYLDYINHAVESLISNPIRYPLYASVNENFRLMPIKNHLIAYEVSNDAIIVLRVLHKNMDTEAHLSEAD